MTSTYDNLGWLCGIVPQHPELVPLMEKLFGYTVDEISKNTPLKWSEWSKEDVHTKEFLGGTLRQLSYFFSDAHNIDHSTKYHFRTISRDLDGVIGKFANWFIRYKDRKDYDRWYGVESFTAATVKKYPELFAELNKLINDDIVRPDEYQMRGVARWSKYC